MTDRERFEAWRSKARPVLSWTFVASLHGDGYHARSTQADWEAWQASRKQALEEVAEECAKIWWTSEENGESISGALCYSAVTALANPEGEQG